MIYVAMWVDKTNIWASDLTPLYQLRTTLTACFCLWSSLEPIELGNLLTEVVASKLSGSVVK